MSQVARQPWVLQQSWNIYTFTILMIQCCFGHVRMLWLNGIISERVCVISPNIYFDQNCTFETKLYCNDKESRLDKLEHDSHNSKLLLPIPFICNFLSASVIWVFKKVCHCMFTSCKKLHKFNTSYTS